MRGTHLSINAFVSSDILRSAAIVDWVSCIARYCVKQQSGRIHSGWYNRDNPARIQPRGPFCISMFENLQEKLQRAFKNLRGQGTLTEENIQEALKEIRMAL